MKFKELKTSNSKASNPIYGCLILVLTIAVSIVLSACKKNDSGPSGAPEAPTVLPVNTGGGGGSPTPSPNTDPTKRAGNGGGGIDGSGGDPIMSTKEDVQKAFDLQTSKLIKRLEVLKNYVNLGTFTFDYLYGKSSYQMMSKFLLTSHRQIHSELVEDFIRTESKIITALEKKTVKIHLQSQDCATKDGKHGGAAKGNTDNGEICLSVNALQKIPKNSLNSETFYLLIHELAHIAGFDETEAVAIQTFSAENSDMFASADDKGFPPRIVACDHALLWHEVKFVNFNPYWRSKLKEISKQLMGYEKTPTCGFETTTPRELAYKFIDDAERLPNIENFVTQFSGYEFTKQSDGLEKTMMSTSNEHGLTNVPSIRLVTDNIILHDLKARLGSKGQCSPRILIASVLAAIPHVINETCRKSTGQDGKTYETSRGYSEYDRIKERVQTQIKILEAAPEMPPLGEYVGPDSW